MLFNYEIIHRGYTSARPLMRGSLDIADVESAKRDVQTMIVPGLPDKPIGLEVVLRDKRGNEIWRGPYLGGVVAKAYDALAKTTEKLDGQPDPF